MPARPHTDRRAPSQRSTGDARGTKEKSNWRGHSPDDYRRALEEGGSIRQAAIELDVARSTVRGQMKRHDIPHPKTGKVPGSDDE